MQRTCLATACPLGNGLNCRIFRLYAATAFDYAVKIRSQVINNESSKAASGNSRQQPQAGPPPPPTSAPKNPIDKTDGAVLPNKLTWSFAGLTADEIVDYLAKTVVWNRYDIVALNKPYNVCCQGGGRPGGGTLNLVEHLPALARRLNCPHLHPVHRLDRTSTGVLLLAKTERQAQHLKRCFKERRIDKYYYCITRDAPNPPEGLVDIPLTLHARHPDGRWRAVLRPRPTAMEEAGVAALIRSQTPAASNSAEIREALTRYRVVDQFERSALVEAQPLTGCKHQIRLHLGLALGTPVLGDHKYSCARGRLLPQRLPPETLQRLDMRPPRARDLPLFLHAQRVAVPVDPDQPDRVSVIKAPFPYRFVRVMRALKLSLPFKLMRSDVT